MYQKYANYPITFYEIFSTNFCSYLWEIKKSKKYVNCLTLEQPVFDTYWNIYIYILRIKYFTYNLK